MSPTAQIIVAVGVGGLLVLFGLVAVIWAIRCDPKRPHYRLPGMFVLSGPVLVAVLAWLKVK